MQKHIICLICLAALFGTSAALAGSLPSPVYQNLTVNGDIAAPEFPNLSRNVEGTGVPGLDGAKWSVYNAPATFDTQPTLQISRAIGTNPANSALSTGGNFQALTVLGTNGPYNIGGEWTLLSAQHNMARENGVSGSVASNGTIYKDIPTNTVATTGAGGTGATATVTFAGGATIPVGHSVQIAGMTPSAYNGTRKVTASSAGSVSFASTTTGAQTVAGTIVDVSVSASWGMNGNCIENTAEADPVGLCLGAEFNVTSPFATTDAGRRRILTQLIAQVGLGGHVGRGLLLGSGVGIIDRGVEFEGNYQTGIDFTGGSYSNVPILLAAGQPIALDGNSSTGAYAHSFFYGSANGINGFHFYSGVYGGSVAGIDDTGTLNLKGGLTLPSQTANTFFAAPNGSAGTPTMRAVVAADLPATLTPGTVKPNSGNLSLQAASGNSIVLTGAAGSQWWLVGNNGDLTPGNDNAVNLGGSGSRIANVYAAKLTTSALVAAGSAPTGSGTCPINTQVGGNGVGSFKLNGACASGTVILTFATAAPNDWACFATDATTVGTTISQNNTAASTTTATLKFNATGASGDLIRFKCMAF